MQYQDTVQWAIAAQMSDIYRCCAAADSIDQAVESLQMPLYQWLGIEAITLAMADDASVIVASMSHLTDGILDRIRLHGARCVEGRGKSIKSPDEILIQQVGQIPRDEELSGESSILWTGALETNGRLIGVITFYRSSSSPATPLELNALRQIRSLVSETVCRLLTEAKIRQAPNTVETSDDISSDIVVVSIEDSREFSTRHGAERLGRVQEEMVEALCRHNPQAFLIARLGEDRIIIIDHPGNGVSLAKWRQRCVEACADIEMSPQIPVRITVELGEVDQQQGQAARSPESPKTFTNDDIGELAG